MDQLKYLYLFQVLFQEWKIFNFTSSFQDFYSSVRRKLAAVDHDGSLSRCKDVPGIDELLTKGMENLID